jgi:hypothetical protein
MYNFQKGFDLRTVYRRNRCMINPLSCEEILIGYENILQDLRLTCVSA